MNQVKTLTQAFIAKNSRFYSNEYLKPFIDRYILDFEKIDLKLKLYHRYSDRRLGFNARSFLEYFIGLRYLQNIPHYFLISLYQHNNEYFEITGFSSYALDDERIFYLIDQGFTNINLPIKIRNESPYFYPEINALSLKESLERIGFETKIQQSNELKYILKSEYSNL